MGRRAWIGAWVLLAIAAAGLLWWRWQAQGPVVSTQVSAAAPPRIEAPPAVPAPAPPLHYPIASDAGQPGGSPADVATTLADLFGRKAAGSVFRSDDFGRRFAATVDSLGRSSSAAHLWPVNPAPGRFLVREGADGAIVAPDNSLRYADFVVALESVDLHQAAAAYQRFYPMLQAAYEGLGYPGHYFNDRLVAVLDQLLATPEPKGPLRVHLPPIDSAARPARPWLLYQFDDPALESLSSGQKILVRMGAVNERRVKKRLAEFRRLVAGEAGRP